MNHNYIRPGGVAADLPDGWEDDVEHLLEIVPAGVREYEELLDENPIFLDRTQGVGIITPDECQAYGVTGPTARASGIDWDVRKAFPYTGIEQYEFDVPLGKHGDVYDRYLVRVRRDPPVAAHRSPGDGDDARGRLPHRRPQGDPAAAQAHRRVDGSAHPPLQDLHRGLQGPGGRGVPGRRVRPRRARHVPGVRRRRQAVARPRAWPRRSPTSRRCR